MGASKVKNTSKILLVVLIKAYVVTFLTTLSKPVQSVSPSTCCHIPSGSAGLENGIDKPSEKERGIIFVVIRRLEETV